MNRAQKEAYKRDYAIAKAEGKPFFPYAIVKDHIVATIAMAIIIGLAIWAPAEIGPRIDPATTDFVPRPEWYFFFLFELLKIFKNQNAFLPLIMATFIVPNILMGLLIAWPFIDRGPERRIHKRPMAMAVGVAVIVFLGWMTYKGATSEDATAVTQPLVEIPADDVDAVAGEEIVRSDDGGCLGCHVIGGVGGNLGPNLSNEGAKNLGIDWHIEWLKNPKAPMPSYARFSEDQLRQVATFVNGLGTKYK